MDPDFKLIYSVDPTKIKVHIRDKFAKLTLSSNKKKIDAAEEKPPSYLTAQKRVSRNLIDELSVADAIVQKESDNSAYINPILRSNSPSRSSDEENETYHESSNQGVLLDQSVEMDSIQLPDCIQNNLPSNTNDINRLTQQVSSLNLYCNRISISSTEDLYESPIQTMPKVEQVSICISSSNDDDNEDDGEDEDDEDSQDAITVSDSSENEDYNAVTSEIPKSGETANNLLPSTLSNDKADRIEAFLRDVSQTRKEMEAGNVCGATDTTAVGKNKLITLADTESMPQDFSGGFRTKDHMMDDTEPMSDTAAEFTLPSQASTNIDAEHNQGDNSSRYLAYDETVANTQASTSTDAGHNEGDTYSRGLAYNETVANTIASDLSVHTSPVHTPEKTCTNYDSIIADSHNSSTVPDESLTILETDSEADNCQHSLQTSHTNTDSDADNCQKPLQRSDTNTALSAQTQPQTSESLSEDSQLLSQPQLNPNSINISAKINIKIHISQQISSDDGSKEESDAEEESQPLQDAQTGPGGTKQDSSSSSEDPQPSTNKNCQGNMAAAPVVSCNTDEPKLSTTDNGCQDQATTTDNDAIEDQNFVQQNYQKLLDELYGSTWRTPEVIRTLNPRGSDKIRKNLACSKDSSTDLDLSSKDVVPANPSVEDSVLDDFSIFRRNIAINLDSTRSTKTPRGGQKKPQTKKHPNTEKKSNPSHLKDQCNFKVPQTEVKKKTRGGGPSNARWRQLDSDSEDDCGNASEDDEPVKTDDDTSSNNENSDESWSKEILNISSSSSESEVNRITKRCPTSRRNEVKTKSKQNKLVYLDLSKNEVEVLQGTPLESNDENIKSRLQGIFSAYKAVEKPRLEATPTTSKTKRKLFTLNFGDECDDVEACCTPSGKENRQILENQNVRINCQPMPTKFEPFNKLLESVKSGTPVFKLQTPKTTKSRSEQKDNMTPIRKQNKALNNVQDPNTLTSKYGFLKSLDVCVGKSLCHPEALYYRDNYRQKKEELAKKLYDLYNEKLFGNKLDVSLVWNKKLLNTAGRCLNKKKMGTRLSNIELSEKVLTSADRLRCTLIHELCHAATWIFNGEGGHGPTWKSWAAKANAVFPEIPKIGVCHQYDIEYKYTYKCQLCAAKSYAHSKSKKVEFIRCSYCHGAIEIFLNKKDKDGNTMATPVREPTGFAKFVRDKYKEYKRPDLKHTDVMKILSNEFAMLKVANGK